MRTKQPRSVEVSTANCYATYWIVSGVGQPKQRRIHETKERRELRLWVCISILKNSFLYASPGERSKSWLNELLFATGMVTSRSRSIRIGAIPASRDMTPGSPGMSRCIGLRHQRIMRSRSSRLWPRWHFSPSLASPCSASSRRETSNSCFPAFRHGHLTTCLSDRRTGSALSAFLVGCALARFVIA